MSRHSSASHSAGRDRSQRRRSPSACSGARDSRQPHRVRPRTRTGAAPSPGRWVVHAELRRVESIIPQRTARASTCRSAWVASNRWPGESAIRQAAISSARSSPTGRSPKAATAFPSSQRSFSIVTGSTSCCSRYTSISSARVSDFETRRSRRSRSSSRSNASAASRSEANPPRCTRFELRPATGTGTPTAAPRLVPFSSTGSADPAATSHSSLCRSPLPA